MECLSPACKVEAEESWERLEMSQKQQKTIEFRASDWPDACLGLSVDACELSCDHKGNNQSWKFVQMSGPQLSSAQFNSAQKCLAQNSSAQNSSARLN